jgi:CBS domain-containing protein
MASRDSGCALRNTATPEPLLCEVHDERRSMDWVVWVVVGAIVILVSVAYLAGRTRARQILAGRSIESAIPSTRADDVMSSPVKVVREAHTVEDAARMMLDEGIRCLPVVGADGGIVGIVTESDLTGARPWLSLRGWAQRDVEDHSSTGRSGTVRVSEVMSSPVVTAGRTDLLADVLDRMMERRIHHVPIVESGIPVGVVARHDVLEFLAHRGTH